MNPVPSDLLEWLSAIEPHDRLPLAIVTVALSLFAAVIIVAVTAWTIRAMHKRRLEISLKRELLDRGMSAEEIALVVRATPTKG